MADAEPVMERGQMKALLVRSKAQPVHCAVGLAPDGAALLLLDRVKQPKALEKQLQAQIPGAKSTRWGTAFVDPDSDPKLVKLLLNKPVNGMARRLRKLLRGTGFSKVEIVLEDGTPVESDLDDEETAAQPTAQARPDAGPAELERLRAMLLALAGRIGAVAAEDAGLKTRLAAFVQAGSQALKAGDTGQAAASIAGLQDALGAVPGRAKPGAQGRATTAPAPIRIDAAPPATEPPLQHVSTDGRALLMQARAAVQAQVAGLQQRLRASGHLGLMQIADAGGAALAARLDTALAKALIEADAAPPDRADEMRARARQAVQAYRGQIEAEPLVTLLERNPLGVPMTIRQTLTEALGQIERALGA